MGSDDATVAPGDVVAGRYRIDAILGQGGYGVVFRATQLPLGRAVALKMLLVKALASPEGRARFRGEAELAQRLEHPNTVRLYDFGETEAGVPFIAWELLRGRPLAAVLAAEGALAPPRVARIAAQTLKALVEAHALGIVHRDVKPANLFLCDIVGETDFVKVLDFGIAKNMLVRGTGLTPEGSVLGTPVYMAPEQARGEPLSPAADLYALGLVMAEMLTGRTVFVGAPLEVLMAQLSDRPAPLPPEVLASPLGPVIARAVEKQIEARFATASEMLEQVEGVVASSHRAPGAVPAARTPAPTAYVAPPTASSPDAYAATASVPVACPGPSHAYTATASAAVASSGPSYAYAATVSAPVVPSGPPAALAATEAALPQAAAIMGNLPPARPSSSGAATAVEAAPPPRGPTFSLGPPHRAIAPDAAQARDPTSAPGRRFVVVAALAGSLAAAVLVIILLATGVIGGLRPASFNPGLGGPGLGAPGPYLVNGKKFTHLTVKQISERIEKANHKITWSPSDPGGAKEGTLVWVLSGGTDRRVVRFCYNEPRYAVAVEIQLSREAGATARDGNCVLNVHLPAAEARALLDQIAR